MVENGLDWKRRPPLVTVFAAMAKKKPQSSRRKPRRDKGSSTEVPAVETARKPHAKDGAAPAAAAFNVGNGQSGKW
jgi:hypothetical protein